MPEAYREISLSDTPDAVTERLLKAAENVGPVDDEIGVDARFIDAIGAGEAVLPDDDRDDSPARAMQPGYTIAKGGGSRNGRRRMPKKKGTWTCPTCKVEFCEHRPSTRGRKPFYGETMAAHPFKPRIFETEAVYLRITRDAAALPLRDVVRIMVEYYERHGIDAAERLRDRALERYRGGGPSLADLEARTVIAERWPQGLLDWWRSTRDVAGINDAVLCREIVTQYAFVSISDHVVLNEALVTMEAIARKKGLLAG